MIDENRELPPLRDLPSGRLVQRKEHLLAEISNDRQSASSRFGQERSLGRRVLRPVPLAATVALTVTLVVGVVLATRVGTTTASAAQVRAKLSQGLDLPESIRGEYTVRTGATPFARCRAPPPFAPTSPTTPGRASKPRTNRDT